MKFIDDIKDPRLDPMFGKDPRIDMRTKNPASDPVIRDPRFDPTFKDGIGKGIAPFILSIPHHSMAWADSYPEAYQAILREYKGRLTKYKTTICSMKRALKDKLLTKMEKEHLDLIIQEYEALKTEYKEITKDRKKSQ